MDWLLLVLPFLVPLGLFGVFLASLPTGIEILKKGNDADPLRKEIEEENRAREEAGSAA